MEAVLADKKIDAVLLTTPHSLHAAHVAAAAQAATRVREGVIAVEPQDKGFCERLCAFSSVCRVES